MKTSKLIPAGFVVVATLLSGATAATSLTAAETRLPQGAVTMQDSGAKRADMRHGQGHGERGPRGFMGQIITSIDADGDGAVTQAEIDSFRSALVAGADTTGEGDISLGEFETIYLELTRDRMVDTFQELDADGDGVVTQAEMDGRFGSIVAQMDRNGDGQLDRADHERRGGERGGDRGGERGGERGGPDRGEPDRGGPDRDGDHPRRGDRGGDRQD
ncbi:EF-hand domain-containing protein [Pararhodobacter oceanensis]|uniref:EF-hand domain-containing protein n=1 Tax=Pararhodobacter oceanensis TaxID=2172121 RepID=UPI003A951947